MTCPGFRDGAGWARKRPGWPRGWLRSSCFPELKGRQCLQGQPLQVDPERLKTNGVQYLAGEALDEKRVGRLRVQTPTSQVEDSVFGNRPGCRPVAAQAVVG